MGEIVVATLLWDPNEHSHEFSRSYSEEWVEKLFDGFRRNLNRPFDFVCFVDRVRRFNRPIKQALLERRPIDYGSCIEPYKLNRPMILVGLDTVVVGNCDPLADYCFRGKVPLYPRDPYRPRIACNGVSLVPAGYSHIWERWNGENDMEWIRRHPHEFIDDHFPGLVLSYKGHVKKKGLGGARIVYFHGKEKPHELGLPWIREHWRCESENSTAAS